MLHKPLQSLFSSTIAKAITAGVDAISEKVRAHVSVCKWNRRAMARRKTRPLVHTQTHRHTDTHR